jgi:hypothetical protein
VKIRELLQIEIWSRRTTRKLFIGFAIVVAAVLTWFGVNGYLLTPGEREAGRTALAQIDSLRTQGFGGDPKDFEVRKQKVQQAVENAEQAAWTTRDKRISKALSLYLGMMDMSWDRVKMDRSLAHNQIFQKHADAKFDKEVRKSEDQMTDLMSLRLHTVLGS